MIGLRRVVDLWGIGASPRTSGRDDEVGSTNFDAGICLFDGLSDSPLYAYGVDISRAAFCVSRVSDISNQ